MIEAIVYTSNAGHTAAYARLLGEKTGLPVFSLAQADGKIPAGAEILYFGWLMAGSVKGYKDAVKRYQIRAVCAVGMGGTGTQTEDVRKSNAVPPATPVFTLQGGFDQRKLHGVYWLMMRIMTPAMAKSLAGKPDRTADEDACLEMVRHGGNYVSVDQLDAVLAWYGEIL